jgi:aspartate carbamoyltransferase catalytic subunit
MRFMSPLHGRDCLLRRRRCAKGYADAIVLRHPEAGAALRASRVASVPVINAGDGTNEHPTQTLVDLFTIWETQGVLSNLSIGLVGDLRFSRTIHSLVKALVQQGVQTFYCICSPVLQLPEALRSLIEQSGSKWIQIDQISEAIPHLHVLYMTRLQIERLPEDFSPVNYQSSLLTMEDLKHAPPYLKILHPLPRVNEIPTDIDETPYAYYFEQAENGLYVRQALLHCILGEDRSDDGLNDDDMDDDLLDTEDEKRHDGLDG